MKPQYRVEGESFVIENYNHAEPFSSFFPALAGETGKPLWVFYTNRGQAISSFGINNKDGAMLEFLPANKAYQATPLLGFRTFVRSGKKAEAWYEPFLLHNKNARQTLIVRPYELELQEVNPSQGLEITVRTFGVPNESCAVLARSLTIKNISRSTQSFQVLDGLPRVVPWGMGDYLVKHMSRTIEAFAEVLNCHASVPFFKLKVEPADRPNVAELKDGFFSFGVDQKSFLPMVVDPHVVFGPDSSFFKASPTFGQNGSDLNRQLMSNIMPSSFSLSTVSLKSKQSKTWYSYFGYTENQEKANNYAKKIISEPSYFDNKQEEMKTIYQDLIKKFGFRSSHATLNAYANNTFMDNVLRGGYPVSLTQQGPVVHLFSRKHGDMERDYNAFQISASYYSQGNGNFRDVNQNRRNDLFLNQKIGTTNVDLFFNLLQFDGFNPLVINPTRIVLPKDFFHYPEFNVNDRFREEHQLLKKKPILPGRLYEFVLEHCKDPLNVGNVFRDIVRKVVPQKSTRHGEGYWIDHWTYNLDHLDHFLTVFPEQARWILFDKKDFTFHDSDHFVRPRKEKYVITKDKKFRQLNAVVLNEEKQTFLASRQAEADKVRTEDGRGEIFKTTLFVKCVALATVKVSSLDPFGVGIEMEAGRPGWCDALNGAPGLFGSSSHEMFELQRLVSFLLEEAIPLAPTKAIEIPVELATFLREVGSALAHVSNKDFRPTWDRMSTTREHFREKTFFGISGKMRMVRVNDIKGFLEQARRVLKDAAKKAFDPQTKLPTSYFTHEVEVNKLPGDWKTHQYKIPWSQHRVAPFLEGAVHAMKVSPLSQDKKIFKTVKKSELMDKKLGMYRLNVSLEKESSDLGRICIFSKGWLENESIFLHMHYKYLLEILRAGLVEEFFHEIKDGVIPFRDIKSYGRPIFENSSFLASSTFPKKSFQGKGFVARLSGATAEFLSMIYHLVLGPNPFTLNEEGGVIFSPKPVLPAEWFSKKAEGLLPQNSLSLTLFGIPLTYVNPKKKNTYGRTGVQPVGFEWILDGRFYSCEGSALPSEPTVAFREGRLENLTITLGRSSKR
ncbi:hypothetical protein BVX98_00555 [bacterium F11]|nr:hypothetical protein BVX98_00555 [bacterium F11]